MVTLGMVVLGLVILGLVQVPQMTLDWQAQMASEYEQTSDLERQTTEGAGGLTTPGSGTTNNK